MQNLACGNRGEGPFNPKILIYQYLVVVWMPECGGAKLMAGNWHTFSDILMIWSDFLRFC